MMLTCQWLVSHFPAMYQGMTCVLTCLKYQRQPAQTGQTKVPNGGARFGIVEELYSLPNERIKIALTLSPTGLNPISAKGLSWERSALIAPLPKHP